MTGQDCQALTSRGARAGSSPVRIVDGHALNCPSDCPPLSVPTHCKHLGTTSQLLFWYQVISPWGDRYTESHRQNYQTPGKLPFYQISILPRMQIEPR